MQVKAERERVHSENNKYLGQREAMFRKIALADELRDEVFWSPHCPDFRGRLYPQAQDLNFVGDDVSRSLIMFAEGKPLGERGVYWMQIRLANTYGMDKLSFEERIKWVEDNRYAILDSADMPIDGERAWCSADEPLAFLAACKEYEGILNEGPGFVSHLPINLDATASGLQHLSAWGRDPVAAKVVNMTNSSERHDIYGVQAEAVNKIIARDIGKGGPARHWHGHVSRKVVKRGVMTLAYSVTPQGLRDQFISDGWCANLEGSAIANANYMRDALMESLTDTLKKPMEIMAYFKAVAGALAEQNTPVKWRTPMGMWVQQAYWRYNKKEVQTLFGKATLWHEEPVLGLSKRKQMLACSPNIIHSYDAAHLQAVVLMGICEQQPITSWACVHDSIGVHGCDVDRLNRIIREEFIRIYDRPVLHDFHERMLRHKVKLPDPQAWAASMLKR